MRPSAQPPFVLFLRSHPSHSSRAVFRGSAMSIDYRGNPWDVSGVNTDDMYDDSCVNTPSRCVCAPFSSTFPTTPTGFIIANPSGTTMAELGATSCSTGHTRTTSGDLTPTCDRDTGLFLAPTSCIFCGGQHCGITDANIFTAVEECQAESATFDCPASQATYGPIEDWDVGAVTSLNTHGNGCTMSAEGHCGRASPIRCDVL